MKFGDFLMFSFPISRLTKPSAVAVILLLAGCGGGGGGDSSNQSAANSDVWIDGISQPVAQNLVRLTNNTVPAIINANIGKILVLGYPYCQSGSNLISNGAIQYNACLLSNTSPALTLNGTQINSYINNSNGYNNITNFNGSYTYSGSYSASKSFQFSSKCNTSISPADCEFDTENARIRNIGSISLNGTNEIVNATAYVNLSASSDAKFMNISFQNWNYNKSIGQATSGSVYFFSSNGNMANITASATGYAVTITLVNGTSGKYTVTY